MDTACILEKRGNENHACFHESGGEIKCRERMIKSLKHIFALYRPYSLIPLTFWNIFSLLDCSLSSRMQACNVTLADLVIFISCILYITPKLHKQKVSCIRQTKRVGGQVCVLVLGDGRHCLKASCCSIIIFCVFVAVGQLLFICYTGALPVALFVISAFAYTLWVYVIQNKYFREQLCYKIRLQSSPSELQELVVVDIMDMPVLALAW